MNRFLFYFFTFVFSVLTACTPLTNFTDLQGNENDPPSTYNTGKTTIVTTKSVGNSGTILLMPTGPLKDVKIHFPSGALSNTNVVEVGYNDGELSSVIGDYKGNALVINVPQDEFKKQISITANLPTDSVGVTPVPFYVDKDGKLNVCQLTSIDRVAGTFTFETFHASTYLWVFVKTVVNQKATYEPGKDGFQINNVGSSWNSGGECLGMSTWSLWWYKNKKETEGDFYSKYMGVVTQDREGNNLTGQDIIATRAHNSVHQQVSYYWGIVNRSNQLSGADHLALISTTIRMTKSPVVMIVYGNGAHALLAYNVNNNVISVYDPNFNNEVNQINYNPTTQSFDGYTDSHNALSFPNVSYAGDGSIKWTEKFGIIADDAKLNFNNTAKAQIQITSPTDGTSITSLHTNIIGKIESSEIAITKIKCLVNQTDEFEAVVDEDGDFRLPVSLCAGDNFITFRTFGNSNSGQEIEYDNSMSNTSLYIKSTAPLSKILVTLTWKTSNSDLDLYVVDPSNDYSCFFHKVTSDGGVLDFDDTDGYGPEHWTLMASSVVKFNQPYKVRVHYYRANSNQQSTNWDVSVRTNEGSRQQNTDWYSGTLSYANSSNNSYNATGSDWADVGTITLAGPPSVSGFTFTPKKVIQEPSLEYIKKLKN